MFSTILLNELNEWKERLLINPTMLGAVYLDPRFQRALNPEQKKTAILFLRSVYTKIVSIENEPPEENRDESEQPNLNESNSSDEMTQYLDALSGETDQNNLSSAPRNVNIERLLKEFNNQKESIKLSVLDFWEKNKCIHPILYKLATVIFSVPPTQTSVERNFSAFANVLTSRRTRLGDIVLENSLIIKTNKEIFDYIRT